MVLLLATYLLQLLVNSLVVGRRLHVADDTEGDGESILQAHHGQLQLQGVVLAVSIVNEHVVECVSVFADLNDLQAESLLYQSELVVLAKDEFLAMTHVDGILLAAFLVVDGIVAAIVEDDAVLQNLADGSALVLIGGLQNVHCSGSIGGNGTGKEVSAGTKAQLSGAEGILNGSVGARLGYRRWRGRRRRR